ncbi:N-formylglutamate amidohydrolase [Rhizobium sp. LjRoot30]|uniref:N-formylglutamate amidohydrolase n=1 Tax=Rhizobium sp. LjRoot30 TaxID=3342320 RepID=UPI003ED071CC
MTTATTLDWPDPVEVLNEAGTNDIVLTCEHASNHIPTEYAGLGLPPHELTRHIAWDIGVAAVTRELARRLDAPAFLGTYSRLLIDLNRPVDSPTSIPARSEATDIPGNIGIDENEKTRRIERMFRPFHDRIEALLDAREKQGRKSRIVGIHSFTPVFHGVQRPWHVGILYGQSKDYAEALMTELRRDPALVVDGNVPYIIDRLEDYAIPVHGEDRGYPAVLVEVRQDLLLTDAGVQEWTDRLYAALTA